MAFASSFPKLIRMSLQQPASSTTDPSHGGAVKNASHAAFYSGVAKGFACGVDGLLLFASKKELRILLKDSLAPLRSAALGYAALCVLLFLLMRNPADSFTELLWTMSRWSRILTVLVSLLLERQFHARSAMFFAALHAQDPAYGAALQALQPVKPTTAERVQKGKRIAKMIAFRIAGAVIQRVFPGGKYIALPAIKFITMRPTLGNGVAAAMAAVHLIPEDILAASSIDEGLVSFGEAILDADDLGRDATRDFSRRLDSAETRLYFTKRYRGYLTGCGFLYSLLSAIPFLGIPLTLICECAAAIVVLDIVQRNLEKDNRRALACEEVLRRKDS